MSCSYIESLSVEPLIGPHHGQHLILNESGNVVLHDHRHIVNMQFQLVLNRLVCHYFQFGPKAIVPHGYIDLRLVHKGGVDSDPKTQRRVDGFHFSRRGSGCDGAYKKLDPWYEFHLVRGSLLIADYFLPDLLRIRALFARPDESESHQFTLRVEHGLNQVLTQGIAHLTRGKSIFWPSLR